MNNLFEIKNSIKQDLANGKISIGLFLLSNSSIISEALAGMPVDWLVIDMEASSSSKNDVLHMLQSMNGSTVTPMIRIAEQNKHLIESGLDLGAKGIIVPKIDTKLQAEDVIRSFYYPPKGIRGINPVRASAYFSNLDNYFKDINNNILSVIQIESKESIDNIEEIAAVPEIDVLFIGCGDLAASYGQIGCVTGDSMNEARKKVLDACKKNNKTPGIFAYSIELANEYIEEGFKFIAIGNDIKLLKQGMADSLNKLNIQKP